MKIITYKWTGVDNSEVISNEAVFQYAVRLITAGVRLTVVYDECRQDRDEISITVTTSVFPGKRCYFYSVIKDPNSYYFTVHLQPQTLAKSMVHRVSWSMHL